MESNILFESDRDKDDQDELYRIQADGTGETLMLRDPTANLVYPVLSPDGKTLLYSAVKNRNVDAYMADVNGENARLWKSHASHLQWSKRRGLVAFIAYDENKLRELYLAKPDGSGQIAVTRLNH